MYSYVLHVVFCKDFSRLVEKISKVGRKDCAILDQNSPPPLLEAWKSRVASAVQTINPPVKEWNGGTLFEHNTLTVSTSPPEVLQTLVTLVPN